MKDAVNVDMEKVGNMRYEHLWTWSELARRSNVTTATIFALKAGRRRASMRTLHKIAHALGVQPGTLIKKDA
ncbi:helix-turn-helix domain-containing protein [Megasphaera sp.]|uniref:helix-turn-helix domain-containing protein n=1 Tax=Megasphaera sp. TaxID=2023260 RepID=UPI0035203E01